MSEPRYPLYHTLNKNLKGRLGGSSTTTLSKKLSKLEDHDTLVIVLMLIIEHARICGDISIGSETLELPYGIRQRSKGTQIDIDKLPVELKEILCKFLKVGKT